MRSFRSAVLAAGAVSLLAASAAHAHAVMHLPKHRRTATTATNWSGYSVDASNATQVIGTWTAQVAHCQPGETSWSSPWVGIDGDVSNTVEQTGTDSDCNGGTPTYYAWYEMYPKNAVTVPITVTPGHAYTGSVTYSGGIFTLSLTDDSTGQNATEHIASKKPRRDSVEWIVEGPSSGLLTDFGQLPFSAASAAFGGASTGLSSFTNANSITMVNSAGQPRATPGPVSSNGFIDTWNQG